jgi:hypothetical protein
MRKSDLSEVSKANRGRVLARVMAEDLRRVDGAGAPIFTASTYSETAPPPGRDITNVGSDGDSY